MIKKSTFTRMVSVVAALIFCAANSASAEVSFNGAAVGNSANALGPLNSVVQPGVASVADVDRVAEQEDAVPEGLTGSDWQGIRQEYERHRHAAVAVDGGFCARNPGQGWLTHFDGRGFVVEPKGADWRWGLELESYGFPGHSRAVGGQAKMTAQNDRVTYEWHAGLREWFVNDRRGLEHGFTLGVRPPGAGDPRLGAGDSQLGAAAWLELRLAVRGGLRAQGHADGRGVSFVNEHGHTVVNYAGLKVWDADHRALPARIDADAMGLRLSVDERGARYPLTIDPIAQQAYLKASNTDVLDRFGESVAVSGNTVVVGARDEDSNATGVNGNQADNSASASGAAYVFVRDSGGVWSQQAYLKASNTGAGDQFGWSVAVSGNTVVVGALSEDSNATGVNGNQADNSAFFAGAAYIFVRDSGGVWSQQAYVKASNTDASDGFGISMAVSGDTVVVGAWREDSNAAGVNGNQGDNSAFEAGAAYVFVRDSGGVWSQQGYLKASNTDAQDGFGEGVAVSGDTVVVGARREASNAAGVNGNEADNSAQRAGAAYVFVRDGASVWSQQAYLKASNADQFYHFGSSVAVSGDTVVVGANQESSNATGVNGNQADNSASTSGAAYVFVRNGVGVWSQQAYLKASNTDVGDWFGTSVAVSGETVVVGAPRENSGATGVNGNQVDNSASASGAAYVFVRDSGGVWSQQAYLKASNTGAGDQFGWSAGVSGDTVVVGASREDSGATGVNGNHADNGAFDSGAAYLFLITPIVCGDGVVEGAEQCDDGDTADGDGCSSICNIEPGFVCNGAPSVCCLLATPPNTDQILNASGVLVQSVKNRFLSFSGGDVGLSQAVRVKFVSLPGAFNIFNGTSAWVALPAPASELPGKNLTDPVGADPSFMAAGLSAVPVFADWSTFGVVHVFDERIIPSRQLPGQPVEPAIYEIQLVGEGCETGSEASFSPALSVTNARWGDLAQLSDGEFRAPDGGIGIGDTLAMLAKFGGAANAPIKARAELLGVGGSGPMAAVDGVISVSDLLEVLAAFSGGSYPFAPPTP